MQTLPEPFDFFYALCRTEDGFDALCGSYPLTYMDADGNLAQSDPSEGSMTLLHFDVDGSFRAETPLAERYGGNGENFKGHGEGRRRVCLPGAADARIPRGGRHAARTDRRAAGLRTGVCRACADGDGGLCAGLRPVYRCGRALDAGHGKRRREGRASARLRAGGGTWHRCGRRAAAQHGGSRSAAGRRKRRNADAVFVGEPRRERAELRGIGAMGGWICAL